MSTSNYRTTELELAAFLKAKGCDLVNVVPLGHLVAFDFDPAASVMAESYFAGSNLPARELFEAHRSLRALIQQVREHSSNRNGGTQTWKNEQHSR